MPINFDQPQTTTAYSSVLSYVRDNVSALSKLLEGETLSGTVPTGAKRYNAGTTFFESWNGSSWVEMPLGYLKLSGGTLTGALSGTSASFSGTVSGTFSGTFSGNGSAVTNLNASNLASGTVPTARLGIGTASSSTFLRGDGTWSSGLSGNYFSVYKNTNSGIEINTPDEPADQRRWFIVTFGSTLSIHAYNDAGVAGQSAMSFTRSGYSVTGFNLKVNDTDVISANSNRQVTIGAPASGSHSINGNVSFSGTISGNGSGITSLNADNLASGTIPGARFPSALPAVSGANLTNLNASSITSGTVAPARLGSGSPSSSTFLRGDGAWTNTLSGDYLILSKDTYSGIFIHTPDQSADQKYWSWITIGPSIYFRAYSDNFASAQEAMVFHRTGASITGWNFNINGSSVITANSNRQVTISSPASGTHYINGGLFSTGMILFSSTAGLPSSVGSSNVAIAAGGYGSPVSGRIYFGDGTGWKLQFCRRTGGTDTVLMEIQDNGNVRINGALHVVGQITSDYQGGGGGI